MEQQTLAMALDQSESLERYRRPTRRDEFLATTEAMDPWAALCAAQVHDKHPLPQLLHGAEREVYGDSACASQQAVIQSHAPKAQDHTSQWMHGSGVVVELERTVHRIKSKARSRVEHVPCGVHRSVAT